MQSQRVMFMFIVLVVVTKNLEAHLDLAAIPKELLGDYQSHFFNLLRYLSQIIVPKFQQTFSSSLGNYRVSQYSWSEWVPETFTYVLIYFMLFYVIF